MEFNTLRFAAFFLVVYGLYLAIDHRWQNRLLLLASFAFYSFWDWRFLSLIILSIAINYYLTLEIDKSEDDKERRRYLVITVCFNLVILGVFKYFNFFIDNLMSFLWLLGLHLDRFDLNIILPLGISFYSLQTMSYPIDVYRRMMKPTKNLPDLALFISFFPLIISGPIERARNILPQILNKREITAGKVYEGCWLFFWGLYKKIVIADNLAKLTRDVFNSPGNFSGGIVFLSVYIFVIQLYADFSGYSDMARGIARLMGFEIMANFKVPFFSSTINDLWQRWHISLTTWIKEYLFYPLALAKFFGRQLSAQAVIIITWAIMGFWHGPESRFILWGLYHGLIIVVYNKLRPYLNLVKPKNAFLAAAWLSAQIMIVFNLFALGIIFFASKSLALAMEALKTIAKGIPTVFSDITAVIPQILLLICPLLILEYFQYKSDDEMITLKWPLTVKVIVYYMIFYSIVMYGDFGVQSYYYFQF